MLFYLFVLKVNDLYTKTLQRINQHYEEFSKEFIKLLNLAKIKQIITSTPPPFAERIIQTIKNMILLKLFP